MIKSILVILIVYFTFRILYSKYNEHFQSNTTSVTSLTTGVIPSGMPSSIYVLKSGKFVGENKITTTDRDFIFPKNNKSLYKKKEAEYTEDVTNVLNSKRLCIREGNDMECIDAHELVNALSLKDYRKNSVCIDESCLTKGNLDILKSLSPSRDNLETTSDKNRFKLKHGDGKCLGNGNMRAHTCSTQTNRLKVIRTDGGERDGGRGWGQPLVVKGKKCVSYYATQEANPGSACIDDTITVGSRGSGPGYVELQPGTYWKFPPGNGNRGVNRQDPRWRDTFRLEIGAGNRMGGDNLTLKSLNAIDCNNNAKVKIEEGRDSSNVFTALGLIDDDAYMPYGSAESINSHTSH